MMTGLDAATGIPCPPVILTCQAAKGTKHVAGQAIASATQSVADSALERFASAVASGVGDAVKQMTTLWVQVPVPGVSPRGTAAWLTGHLWWYMSALAVLSVIIAGARMAWHARGGEAGRELVRSLLTLSLVSAAGLAVINTALQAGDAYSVWILRVAGGPSFGKRMAAMMSVLIGNSLGVMLVILIGVLSILAAIGQILLMVARSATLVVLAGMWPLSASATNTDWGQRWFKKVTAWIVAFSLYKPAAATIYAAGIQMFGNEKSLLGALMGLATMALALLAMPALMRLCVPLVGGLSDGAASGGGGAGAAVGMAAGAFGARGLGGGSSGGPSGAIPVPALPSQGTGSGGGGSSGGGPAPGGPGGGQGPTGSSGGGGSHAPAPSSRPSGAVGQSGQTPAAAGAGSAGSSAGAGAASGASAGAAGAAAGPAGIAASAAVETGQAVARGARQLADDSTREGGL